LDIQGSFESPFTTGLQQYVRKRLEILIPVSLQASLRRLVLSPPKNVSTRLDKWPEFAKTSTTILFSTPGAGKTRCLLDLLNNAFGMYIVAPGVSQRSSGWEDPTLEYLSLLQPFRGNASEDTSSLQEAFDAAPFKISELDVRELSETIMFARLIVFDTFLKLCAADQNISSTPYAWSQLQVNCSVTFDPFDLAWRLVRLDHATFKEYAECWNGKSSHDLIWCIDEVQVALEDGIGKTFLDTAWFTIHNLESKAVLSGTALRLRDLRRIVDPWAEEYDELRAQEPDWANLDMAYWVATKFSRIDDFSPFWTLYQQHIEGLVNESIEIQGKDPGSQSVAGPPLRARAGRPLGFRVDLSNLEALNLLPRINEFQDKSQLPSEWAYLADIHAAIQHHCPVFFGRYRWPTLFIEQILKQAVISIQKSSSLALISVDTAARDASKAADKALRTQLSRIQDRSWAEDLYWMAIRADIFSQSSVIEDKTAQLVSEGFVLVEELKAANDGTRNDSGPSL
jgi:hypothetical protein